MSIGSRFDSLSLGRGKRTLNRVVVPPMASETASPDGVATAATVARYAGLAASGAGIVFVEYTYVHPSGRSELNQLGLTSAAHAEGLRPVLAAIKARGAVAGLQLTHAGGKTSRDLTGGVLQGPSAVAVPVKDRVTEPTTPMTRAEIAAWKAAFVEAAARAVALGFDLIELHCAHGYGLNQWLSPITNRRDDEYGGDLARRARLVLELVGELRERFPATLLAARVPGQDFLPGGLTPADGQQLARWLVAAGLDLVDVSSGLGGWRRPGHRDGEGYLVDEACGIQSAVPVPVIGVGGIQTGAYIDALVGAGALQLAAVGRAILADPAGWGERELSVPLTSASRRTGTARIPRLGS